MKSPDSTTLNLPLPTLKLNLDPHKMEDLYSMFISLQLHRGLFRFLPDGKIENDIAESWVWNDNKTKLEINLGNRFFSDGTTITSKHVQLSLARIFTKEASIRSDMNYIKGNKKFLITKNISDLGIYTISSKKVVIELKRPTPLLFSHLATVDCSIFKIENFEDDIPINKAVSGPYQLMQISDNQIILSLRSDLQHFHTLAPKIVHLFLVSPDMIQEKIKELNLDTVELYPPNKLNLDKLYKEGWNRHVSSISTEYFALINPTKIQKQIRKEMIQRAESFEIAQKINLINFKTAFGIIPDFLPGAMNNKVFEYEEKNVNINQSITIDYNRDSEIMSQLANILQTIWKDIFSEVNLRPLSVNEYFDFLFNKKSQVIVGAKGLDYPDGFSNLAYFKTNVKSNYFFMESNSLDNEIEELPFYDDLDRPKKYIELQNKILNQFTFLPLLWGIYSEPLWSPKLKKVPEHPLGIQFLPIEMLEVR